MVIIYCTHVIVDEDYSTIGANLDENIREKIISGNYVDFAKLIPKDNISVEEDRRLEIVTKKRANIFSASL